MAISQIAKTIIEQIGGNHFAVMCGVKMFVCGTDHIQFRFGRNSTRANFCKITLNANDYYDMEFQHVPNEPSLKQIIKYSPEELLERSKPKTLKLYTDICFDELQSRFTEFTGMNTRLF